MYVGVWGGGGGYSVAFSNSSIVCSVISVFVNKIFFCCVFSHFRIRPTPPKMFSVIQDCGTLYLKAQYVHKHWT